MLRLIAASAVVLALSACGAEEKSYVTNRILRDSRGCAFLARPGAGDTVFLHFTREESNATTCKFPMLD